MKNVLVTGASGLLGGNLCYLFHQKGYRVCGVLNKIRVAIPGVEFLSVADLQQSGFEADVVIHCAAKTNVDACEKEPDDALEINVRLTENVISFANRSNALLIHISTDAVYADRPEAKKESAPLAPLSIYAKTKLQAEEAVQKKAGRFYVVRTNLFGYNILNKYSLAEWVYYNLREGKSINGFDDVYFSPILANELFTALQHLIAVKQQSSNEVLNIGASDSISKYGFAVSIASLFGLDQSLIKKTSVHDFGFAAPRANNSVMDSGKFETITGLQLPTVQQCLNNFFNLHQEGYSQRLKEFNKNH